MRFIASSIEVVYHRGKKDTWHARTQYVMRDDINDVLVGGTMQSQLVHGTLEAAVAAIIAAAELAGIEFISNGAPFQGYKPVLRYLPEYTVSELEPPQGYMEMLERVAEKYGFDVGDPAIMSEGEDND